MSNIDHKRSALDAILAESGYVHPESHENNYEDAYQSYTGDDTNPYASHSSDAYAVGYDQLDEDSEKQLAIETKKQAESVVPKCPTCNEKAMYMCECSKKDMMCKNNHIWYIVVNNRQGGNVIRDIIKEDPHESDE